MTGSALTHADGLAVARTQFQTFDTAQPLLDVGRTFSLPLNCCYTGSARQAGCRDQGFAVDPSMMRARSDISISACIAY